MKRTPEQWRALRDAREKALASMPQIEVEVAQWIIDLVNDKDWETLATLEKNGILDAGDWQPVVMSNRLGMDEESADGEGYDAVENNILLSAPANDVTDPLERMIVTAYDLPIETASWLADRVRKEMENWEEFGLTPKQESLAMGRLVCFYIETSFADDSVVNDRANQRFVKMAALALDSPNPKLAFATFVYAANFGELSIYGPSYAQCAQHFGVSRMTIKNNVDWWCAEMGWEKPLKNRKSEEACEKFRLNAERNHWRTQVVNDAVLELWEAAA